jgi:hypothetical protein
MELQLLRKSLRVVGVPATVAAYEGEAGCMWCMEIWRASWDVIVHPKPHDKVYSANDILMQWCKHSTVIWPLTAHTMVSVVSNFCIKVFAHDMRAQYWILLPWISKWKNNNSVIKCIYWHLCQGVRKWSVQSLRLSLFLWCQWTMWHCVFCGILSRKDKKLYSWVSWWVSAEIDYVTWELLLTDTCLKVLNV